MSRILAAGAAATVRISLARVAVNSVKGHWGSSVNSEGYKGPADEEGSSDDMYVEEEGIETTSKAGKNTSEACKK